MDAVTSGDRLAFALAFLRERLASPLGGLSNRPLPWPEPVAIATARAAVARTFPGQGAPVRAIDVVTGSAGLGFEAGLALERAVFEELRGSAQATALRHIFFAERGTAKVPGLGSSRPLERIGIVGGGTMGAGIAAACLLAGLRVALIERDEASLVAGRDRLAHLLAEAERRGKLSADLHADIVAERLVTAVDMAALAEADLIIEAVFESMGVKQDVFRALDRVAKPGAVLATNTSYLDVAAIAAVTARPADVIGLHFFSPAHVMKLLEIVVPTTAGADAVATGFALAKRLGKLGVWAGNAEGFIGNRVLSAYRRAAEQMVEDGASPYDVDAAFIDFGFPIGLYAMQDMAGLDIGWATRKRLAPTRDPAERYVAISDRICERGWFGRKTGRGYYIYENKSVAPESGGGGHRGRRTACQGHHNAELLQCRNPGAHPRRRRERGGEDPRRRHRAPGRRHRRRDGQRLRVPALARRPHAGRERRRAVLDRGPPRSARERRSPLEGRPAHRAPRFGGRVVSDHNV